jgi:hypothetical protein
MFPNPHKRADEETSSSLSFEPQFPNIVNLLSGKVIGHSIVGARRRTLSSWFFLHAVQYYWAISHYSVLFFLENPILTFLS